MQGLNLNSTLHYLARVRVVNGDAMMLFWGQCDMEIEERAMRIWNGYSVKEIGE